MTEITLRFENIWKRFGDFGNGGELRRRRGRKEILDFAFPPSKSAVYYARLKGFVETWVV